MKKALLFALVLTLVLGACSANRQKLSPQANLNLKSANVYYQQKDNETSLLRALDLYERVLSDNPDHVVALKRSADLNLYFATKEEPAKAEKDGVVQYLKMENAKKVIGLFQITHARYSKVIEVMDTFEKLNDDEKAVRRDSQRKKESSWVRLFKIGQLQFENKLFGDAVETFEIVYNLDKTRQEALRMLVAVYQETGDNEKFELYMDRVLAVAPDDADMIKLKGAYHYNKKEYAEAAEYFRRTMLTNPLDTNNMLLLSSCYAELKDYQPALDILVRVLRLEPENLDVLISAKDLSAVLNNKTAEIEYWKRILALDSSVKNLEDFSFRMFYLEEYQTAMPYAEMWYEKDNTNKLAVSTCITLANKIGRPDLEKKYSDIYKRLQ
jgi:tetratricopeptide (TPR) repeat protein